MKRWLALGLLASMLVLGGCEETAEHRETESVDISHSLDDTEGLDGEPMESIDETGEPSGESVESADDAVTYDVKFVDVVRRLNAWRSYRFAFLETISKSITTSTLFFT